VNVVALPGPRILPAPLPRRCACCGGDLGWQVGPGVLQPVDPLSNVPHVRVCPDNPFTTPGRARALAQAHLVQADLESSS
jgi:hypothetical protein